jgi:hypothetical protein
MVALPCRDAESGAGKRRKRPLFLNDRDPDQTRIPDGTAN